MLVNREEFEKLPEVDEIIKNEKAIFIGDGYRIRGDAITEAYLDGAWYAWQEQQKKMTQAYITLGEALNNTPDNYEDAIREAMDDLK